MKKHLYQLLDDSIVACDIVPVDGNAPMEFDVLSEGTYKGRIDQKSGKPKTLQITRERIVACYEHFKARRQRHPERDLVIDYEHQTLGDEIAPAAGWIGDLVLANVDGKAVLRAKVSSWTKRAAEFLANKEYRYFSPVLAIDAVDKETGQLMSCIFVNGALTNEPLFDGLRPLVSKATFNEQSTFEGKDTQMDDLLTSLRYFLNLPVTATAEDILAELKKLISNIQTAISAGSADAVTAKALIAYFGTAVDVVAAKTKLVLAIGGTDTTTTEQATAMIVAAKENATKVVQLQARVTELEQAQLNGEVDMVVAKGVNDGKILPATVDAMKEFARKDMAAFKLFLEKQPVIGPVAGIPPAAGQREGSFTETDLVVAKQMGLTEDQLKQYSK